MWVCECWPTKRLALVRHSGHDVYLLFSDPPGERGDRKTEGEKREKGRDKETEGTCREKKRN